MDAPPLRLGTRASPLALTQAHMVRDALCAAHGWGEDAVVIVPLSTSGDRIQDRALAEVGGKALWTKELDRALCSGTIDLAVHSMKDVETVRPVEIAIAAVLPRADVRDRLIGAASIAQLPDGAVVGTSAPRRAAQLLKLRPDLKIVLFRGNVGTRLAKLAAGEADATLLAAAGLERLGRHDVGTAVPVEVMLPAPAQGAIGVEVRAEDAAVRAIVAAIDHGATRTAVRTERALLYALGADCRSPVAALARVEAGAIRLRAEILTNDGSHHLSREDMLTAPEDAAAFAAAMLRAAAAPLRALFAGMRPLLVLRPQPGANATAARIRALGLVACVVPLFELTPVDWVPPPAAEFDQLLVTSAAALRLWGDALGRYRRLPMVAVGEATAVAARAAGFDDVRVAPGGTAGSAAELLPIGARVLHPAGEDRIEVEPPGVTIRRITVYAARTLEPSPALFAAIEADAVALIHSPRAGARFAALVRERADVDLAAISVAALGAAGTGWRRTRVADRPTDASLVAAAAALVRAE